MLAYMSPGNNSQASWSPVKPSGISVPVQPSLVLGNPRRAEAYRGATPLAPGRNGRKVIADFFDPRAYAWNTSAFPYLRPRGLKWSERQLWVVGDILMKILTLVFQRDHFHISSGYVA